jgi:CheY-like chemotaxis protein
MSKLILAIEDDQDISELYKELFSEAGYQVRLMKFKPADVQCIGQLQPDLIISDWGLEQHHINWNFINDMHDTPSTTSIPIVVCTALSLKVNQLGERLNTREIKVLEKPFDIDELLTLVETAIGEHQLCLLN